MEVTVFVTFLHLFIQVHHFPFVQHHNLPHLALQINISILSECCLSMCEVEQQWLMVKEMKGMYINEAFGNNKAILYFSFNSEKLLSI